MVRLMGSEWARFVADDLYERNEPITSRNTYLNRHMDLFNNSQGRAIGRSVPAIHRQHYLFGVEIWRERALGAEWNMVEAGCLRALGRLQLLFLHR